MKVAIIGSRRYENKKKIKDFVFKLKQQYGDKTIVVSGGCKTGADKYAKKYALELGLQYEEYPPFHEVHNLYCVLPESRYNKDLIFIETQTGTYFGEDDIVRIEDDYGRNNEN